MKLDEESVKKLLLALLASSKGSYTLNELNADFKEMNGSDIPFRDMGFNSLVDFLHSEPSMFRVSKSGMNSNQYEVSPVIDETLSSLRRLVSGQKSSGSKKRGGGKKKKSTSNYYSSSGGGYYGNSGSTRKYAPPSSSTRSYTTQQQSAIKKPSYWNETKTSNSQYSSTQQPSRTTSTSNVLKKVVNNHVQSSVKPQSLMTTPLFGSGSINEMTQQQSPASAETTIQSLWITNASYFLSEYEIKVTHVAQCDTVFLRLIGPDFGEKYDEMQKEMAEFYSQHGDKYRVKELELNAIAVVFDNSYHRVKIESIKDNEITCYFLDLGRQTTLRSKELIYTIVDQFLKLRFQAIQVKLEKLSTLFDSKYLRGQLEKCLLGKNFICKRTSKNPLTVELFDKTTTSLSVTGEFLTKNRCFVTRQLHAGQEFYGPITYIDETSLLTYVHIESSSKFLSLMEQMNKYYESMRAGQIGQVLNEAIKSKLQKKDEEDINASSYYFAAMYHVDKRWYRVKYVRHVSPSEIQVLFVDFGNKEVVSVNDLMLMPPEFVVFANMPPQAIPVSFMHSCFDLDVLKEYWFENKDIHLRVLRFNSVDLPTVEIVEAAGDIKPTVTTSTQQVNEKTATSNGKVIDKEESKQMLIKLLETQPVESNLIQVKTTTTTTIKFDMKASSLSSHVNQQRVTVVDTQSINKLPSVENNTNSTQQQQQQQSESSAQARVFKFAVNNNLDNIQNQLNSKTTNHVVNTPPMVKKNFNVSDENIGLVRSNNNQCGDELELVKKLESFHFGPKSINELYARAKKIETHQLPHKSSVMISNAAHPTDLKLIISELKETYDTLIKDMLKFYRATPDEYLATEVRVDGVYALLNGVGQCKRVRIVAKMFGDMYKYCDIDMGSFNVKTKTDKLFHLKKEFIVFKAYAIKAKLANIKPDMDGEKWSKSAIDFFTKSFWMKRLESVTKSFDTTDLTYTVELYDENGSLASQLIQHKLAKPDS